MKPLVSIVIPTYNRAYDLRRALDSIIIQSYSNWEVIIVDNNSTDDTDYVINSFHEKKFRLFKIENKGLIAASRNLGIRESKGEYIAFLDSDDWWKESKISAAIDQLEKGHDILYHDLFLVNKNKQRFFFKKTHSKILTTPVFYDLLKKGCTLPHSSVVIRKTILTRLGGLPENYEIDNWGDYYGWLEISRVTNKFIKLPGVYGYYWTGGGNYTTPERTLSAINFFEILYRKEIQDIGEHFYNWINYTKGMLYWKLGKRDLSIKRFTSVKFELNRITIYIKARIMLISIRLKLI